MVFFVVSFVINSWYDRAVGGAGSTGTGQRWAGHYVSVVGHFDDSETHAVVQKNPCYAICMSVP